jgi:hypothetical protein
MFWRHVWHPEKQFFCARDSSQPDRIAWQDCDMPDADWSVIALDWLSKEYVEGVQFELGLFTFKI